MQRLSKRTDITVTFHGHYKLTHPVDSFSERRSFMGNINSCSIRPELWFLFLEGESMTFVQITTVVKLGTIMNG